MQPWFGWYLGLSIGTLGACLLWLHRRAPGRAGPAVGRVLAWALASAFAGTILWTLLGCVVGGLLETRLTHAGPAILGCVMTAWFFAGFVALVLLPGYAGLLALYLCVTAFSEHASRRMVTTATAVLAVPGILLVVASFAGTFEPTPSWDWPEALRPFPFVAASIWGALLLPRLAFTSLAPGTVEGSGNAGIAPAAV